MPRLLAVGAVLAAAQLAHANLIVNPGFESGAAGWSFSGGAISLLAHSGFQAAAIGAGNYVLQEVSDSELVDGADYLVSFWLTSDGSEVYQPGGSLQVYFGNTLMYSTSNPLSSPNAYVQLEFTVAAEPGNMTFVLQPINLSTGTFYLDDVSIEAASVPEPSTGVLLIAGALWLAAWKRRAYRHARNSFNLPNSTCDFSATRSSSYGPQTGR